MRIELESVIPTETQTAILYDQLSKRRYTISHEHLPSYTAHKKFVKTNPYRAWYIIIVNGKTEGNIYVQHDNSIGLNNVEEINCDAIGKILVLLREKITPLPPIASVRFKDFFLNVACENKNLQMKLHKLGYKARQLSYIADK